MSSAEQQERPLIHFTRGTHRFEIFPTRSDQGVGYVGFYDGRLSVAASEKHLVTRMLLLRR